MCDYPEQMHHVQLCPNCGGLDAVTLPRLGGVHSLTITLEGGRTYYSGPGAVYIAPRREPCTATREAGCA